MYHPLLLKMDSSATKNWRDVRRGLGTYITSNHGGRPPSWPALLIAIGCGIMVSKLMTKRAPGPA